MFAMSNGRPAPARSHAVVRGDTYRFTILTSRLIRMEWHPQGAFVDERTQAVVDRDGEVPDFRVVRTGEALEIITEHLHLRYDGGEFSPSGLSVTLERGATDPHYSVWRFGQVYPQGLPYRGNLGGTARTLDDVDGETEIEPGILATYGFAVLDDSTSALLSADGWIAPRPPGGTDLYLFAYGRDYPAALRDFHRLCGPTPVVPRYVLGNWWSRYFRYDEAGYLALMDRFEREQIPLAVAVIDMDWHLVDVDPQIGTGWTGYTWNRDLFPDPARFLAALHERGLAVTLNTHPADGIRRHEERYREVAAAVGIDPDSGTGVPFDVTSREFVDAYLRLVHHPLEEEGVDFWWLDWQSGGVTRIPGLDPLWMLNHIHFLDSARRGQRPITFSRYAGLGSHRYPIGFSGDTVISWASLDFQPRFTASAANVGYGWWSHDIGGHMFGSRDEELTVRWFQFGAFSPVNRLHSSSSPFTSKEPWTFGPAAEAIMGRFLRLRHHLVPMLYTAAWAAHRDAQALFRPMYHDYPRTDAAFAVPNQAMLGEHLLLAPITSPQDPAARVAGVAAWLPPDDWFDVFSGRRYRGERTLTLHRSLAQYPVLARAGSVLPLAEDAMAPVSDRPEVLVLRVFPGDGVSHLVEDDGEANPVARTVTFSQRLSVADDGVAELALEVTGPGAGTGTGPRRVLLDIVGAAGSEGVSTSLGSVLAQGVMSDGVASVLGSALRIDLGMVEIEAGFAVKVTGLRPVARDRAGEAFAVLQAAEISFTDKERAWRAVTERSGLAAVTELGTVSLPPLLVGALVEILDGLDAW